MQNQYGDIQLSRILSETCLREGFDAIIGALESTYHPLQPPALYHTLAQLGALSIEPEERTTRDILEELRSIFRHVCAESIKDVYRKPTRVCSCLDHKRRDKLIKTALDSLLVPWLPTNLATSSPLVE